MVRNDSALPTSFGDNMIACKIRKVAIGLNGCFCAGNGISGITLFRIGTD
jgi:hypothetical protein